MTGTPGFHVIGAEAVRRLLEGAHSAVKELVRDTYLEHHGGRAVNPPSHFLRMPDQPTSRIIALAAHLSGGEPISGLKWIASYPSNLDRGLPRASAVLILNDSETGFPLACLEASQISAARTAASAAVAAEALVGNQTPGSVAFIGAGVIARTVAGFLASTWSEPLRCAVYDHAPQRAARFAESVGEAHGWSAGIAAGPQEAIGGAQLVVLATTAASPHLTAADCFAPGQVVLNLSLRDIGPELMFGCRNIVDDIDHCLTASTSPHLTEQRYGTRSFVDGTLAGLLLGEFGLVPDRPVIFSPFGLGVLDLALGQYVYRSAIKQGLATELPSFFSGLEQR